MAVFVVLHFNFDDMSKPAILKGTRDFGPEIMVKRNYIFNTIRSTFERFGFLPIETPAMERIETLTGKYGEEGDQLIFKILNNGDFLSKADQEAIAEGDSKKTSFSISKKALRYDLTVPFARFVVMNQSALSFPFKRYQIQPVWRGDRPGRGRYQEFYQCDVDVVGSDSLINEVELIQIFENVLSDLQIPNFRIKLNNRKILAGLADLIGASSMMTDMCVAIDKLDKIGKEKVKEELINRGFSNEQVEQLSPIFSLPEDSKAAFALVSELLKGNELGEKGLEELNYVIGICESLGVGSESLAFDPLLARGLNYYTGAIFEVKVDNVSVGSICGGGRYDDLTGIFGLPNVSGVGISFGADRIYDVLEELNLFPESTKGTVKLLFVNFGEEEALYCMKLLKELRAQGLRAEIYPGAAKMAKQMKYANDKNIPYVAVVGSREMETGLITIKNMASGEQESVDRSELFEYLV